MVLSQKLHEAFKGTVERITSPRTVSAFKEKGVLSVNEFVIAGDNLVSKCPTWSWESGDPNKRKSYLPSDKQFLITRNVPCMRRVASIQEEYEAAGGEILLDDEDNDGWLATHGKPKDTKDDEEENVPSIETLEISKNNTIQSIPSYFCTEEEDDIPDMDTIDEFDNLIEQDPATLQPTYLVAHEPEDDNILRTRTYDVSITYDKYYQTPRVWLTGYDESRMLLDPELVLEDVSQDHARKTGILECNKRMNEKHKLIDGSIMRLTSPYRLGCWTCCTTRFLCTTAHHSILESVSFKHRFKNWQEQRKHKLTASTFAQAVGFWPNRRVLLWLEKIGAVEPFTGNLATCWNNIKEEEALERYKLITGNSVLFPEFQVSGKLNREDNWLGASPDGIIDKIVYGLPDGGILEIKCPFYKGDMRKGFPWSGVPYNCIPQAQGLMEILNRDWMDFYVWTPKGSSITRIDRDAEYWKVLEIALSGFWWDHVQPAREIYCKNEVRDPLTELKSLCPAPKHELCNHIVIESRRVAGNSRLLMREIFGRLID